MSALDLLRSVGALGLVLAMIALGVWLVRRMGLARLWDGSRPGAKARLEVVETRAIDVRHKLVLVACDQRRHLLLLGPNSTLLIESGKAAPTPRDEDPA
ncbi:MAG: FliO/MopB family protein [Pseudomonadota bacterium]